MMEYGQYSNNVPVTYHLTPRDSEGAAKPILGAITAVPNNGVATATVSGTDITVLIPPTSGTAVDVNIDATDVYGNTFTDKLRLSIVAPPPPPLPANHFTAVQDPPFVP